MGDPLPRAGEAWDIITLSFDEMKTQNGIMWSRSTGLFSGWTETSPFEEYEKIKDVLGEEEDLCRQSRVPCHFQIWILPKKDRSLGWRPS